MRLALAAGRLFLGALTIQSGSDGSSPNLAGEPKHPWQWPQFHPPRELPAVPNQPESRADKCRMRDRLPSARVSLLPHRAIPLFHHRPRIAAVETPTRWSRDCKPANKRYRRSAGGDMRNLAVRRTVDTGSNAARRQRAGRAAGTPGRRSSRGCAGLLRKDNGRRQL